MPMTAAYDATIRVHYNVLSVQNGGMLPGDIDDGTARRAAMTHIVAANAQQLCIAVKQNVASIALRIEVWDSTPTTPPPGSWDGWHDATFDCPSGAVEVDNTTGGRVLFTPGDDTRIPVPPGLIHATVYLAGRIEAAEAVMEAVTAPADVRMSRLQALAGLERNAIQLAPDRG
ncbi:hypothetical protein ABZS66_56225 [Dactylosporangium sp. NPDC005572]|uniref:hypothetical protein n=1 Tax=Dactylosporangium sp. NPDC005572 TaxID=3156889 RepID=UPI0033AE61DA